MATEIDSGPVRSTAIASRLIRALATGDWRACLAVVSVVAAILIAASVLQDLRLYLLLGGDISSKIWLLDPDSEESISTWLSILLAFYVALITYRCGADAMRSGARFGTHWFILSALFILVAFDDFAGLHEKMSSLLSNRSGPAGIFYNAWALPAGIISLAGLALFTPFVLSFAWRIALLMLLSAALFLGGAVGLEMIGGSVYEAMGPENLRYRALTNTEEALELAGLLLFTYAVLLQRETGGPGPSAS